MADDNLQQCAQCAERAWRLAYALMRNAHDAEDVVQESFVVAARRRDRIPSDDPWPWFATVVTNVARNARRTRRKHMHDEPRDTPAHAPDADLSVLVAEALAQLPEPERDALACTHLSGLTQAQAAEALEVPTGTVATRVRSGLAKLREKLGKDEKKVAYGIGIMFIPQPTDGFQVATQRWVATAQSRASQLPSRGEGMKTRIALGVMGVAVIALLVWLGLGGFDYRSPEVDIASDDLAGMTGSDSGTTTTHTPLDNASAKPDTKGADNTVDDNNASPDTTEETDGVVHDGAVRLGLNELATIDPMGMVQASEAPIVELMYEPLFEVDPFEMLATRPLVAAGPLVFSADYMSAVVTVRDDVYFVDDPCFQDGKGRLATAEDVVYSLKRALLVSPRRSTLSGQVKGANEFGNMDDAIEGIQVLDRFTVAFEFVSPAPLFARDLCGVAFSVIPREAVEHYGEALAKHAVGTGPFVLETYGAELVSLVRNPAYRDVRLTDVPAGSPLKPYEGRRLPLVDRVEFVSGVRGIDAALAGTVSITSVKAADLAPYLEEGHLRLNRKAREAGLSLVTQVTDGSQIIEFDMRNEVIGTPGGEKARAMRRAISVAFDRRGWTESVMGYGGVASASLLPPETVADINAGGVPIADHELGRRYLRDAGFLLHHEGDDWVAINPDSGEQPKLTVTLRGDEESSTLKGKAMVDVGRALGLKIEVGAEPDWNSFVKLRMGKEGKGQMYDMGWSGGGWRPGGRYDLYSSDSPFSSYSNPEYDTLVDKLDGLLYPGTHEYRAALDALPRVVEILEHDVPVFVIAYGRALYVCDEDLVHPAWRIGSGTHKKYWAFTDAE